MPYQEKQIEKKYFTIGEVAEQLGVATSLLRFWEQEFPDYIKPGRYHKAGRKNRKYTLDDIEDVKKIYYLVKVRGFTLHGARTELRKETLENAKHAANIRKKIDSIRGMHYNPMTLEDYKNVDNELRAWVKPESAEEVEKYLAKLGYKIVKI
jgi:DNA-binding transcriptional MerR regulator